jgi:superoxide dismutase, Fe-Mn family
VDQEENMTGIMSRRGFLAGFTTLAAGLVANDLHAVSPPMETGLASEGLLAGRPGFQPRTVMPLPHEELSGFLSRAQLEAHHAEYVRDVERLKEAEERLQDAGLDAVRYGDARRAQVAAANGVLLHELYFATLAPAKVELPRYVEAHLREHMGGVERWAVDFTRCALAAKAWAVLVYDPYDDRWHNAIMESDDAGVWLGANPLVVCDVSAHAFDKDYRGREEYVAKLMDHIDWNEVAKRYKAVDRM